MTPESQTLPQADEDIYYPSSDGKPMAETELHVRLLMSLYFMLREFLRDAPDIWCGANMFWYWQRGRRDLCRAPDVMVVKGVDKRSRSSFQSWKDNNAVPCFIIELTSEDTWQEDLHAKRELYARLGVREYFLYDLEEKWLQPALQGFRLDDLGVSVPLEPDAEQRLFSQELRLFLQPEGTLLRLIDAATGSALLTPDEAMERRNEEHRAMEQALQREATARQAEVEARHQAEVAQQRASEAQQRAELLAKRLREAGLDPDAS